jgi:glycosyltransferase involved in cell wall biosynthesis
MSKLIVFDASRCRSGGAINHLQGILGEFNPNKYDCRILVFTHNSLIEQLKQYEYISFEGHSFLERNLFYQIFWQKFILKKRLKILGTSLLFSLDSSSFCNFSPQVALNQDLLAYEKAGISSLSGVDYIRALSIRYVQNICMRNCDGVIFLTEFASSLIQSWIGVLNNTVIIPHGVDSNFKVPISSAKNIDTSKKISIIYVSPIIEYKNHKKVIDGCLNLTKSGYPVELNFVGSCLSGYASEVVEYANKIESTNLNINFQGFCDPLKLPDLIIGSDIFLFASSCESFGITLLEGMSAGAVIACSNQSSLPETLKDGGVYFDPLNPDSISECLLNLINDPNKQSLIAERAHEISKQYNWNDCSKKTFQYLTSFLKT